MVDLLATGKGYNDLIYECSCRECNHLFQYRAQYWDGKQWVDETVPKFCPNCAKPSK